MTRVGLLTVTGARSRDDEATAIFSVVVATEDGHALAGREAEYQFPQHGQQLHALWLATKWERACVAMLKTITQFEPRDRTQRFY